MNNYEDVSIGKSVFSNKRTGEEMLVKMCIFPLLG